MKTIHIKNRNQQSNYKLIRTLYNKCLKNDLSFHFLVEPDLIIRTGNDESRMFIYKYLIKKKIEYETTDYPLTEKGFGEDKKSVMNIFTKEMKIILHWLSILSLKTNHSQYMRLHERMSHCMLNMGFYEWIEEVAILNRLSYRRTQLIIESDLKRMDRKI